MKKLITAIAAIATSFGLFAADFAHSVTNDICFKTNNLVVGYDKDGVNNLANTPMPMVNWFADSLKTNFTENIANYEQPELKGEAPDQCLAIDTDVKDPVLRTFSAVAKDEGVDNWKYDQVGITDHGVFIDTWTTFTLFDTDPEAPSDSKILVWAKETEADADAGIEGATNLMVTCGIADAFGAVTPTNYVLDVDGIVPETMYRLTIRADKAGNAAKFRVYLNETQLETVDGLKDFPSIDGGSQTLGSAGFGGTGSLKSVDLLTEIDAPEFAADATTVLLAWDSNVESITINGTNVIDGQVSPFNYQITTYGQYMTATIAYAEGYRRSSVTPTGFNDDEYSEDVENNQFTFKVARYQDAGVEIVSELDADVASVTVDDDPEPVDKRFSSMNAILAYLNELSPSPQTATIALKGDLSTMGFSTLDNLGETVITIDLKGYVLSGLANPSATPGYDYLINNMGYLHIVDTVGNGQVVAGECDGIIYNFGGYSLTLGQGGIKYNGAIYNECDNWSVPGKDIWGEITIFDGKFKPNKLTVDGENIKWGEENLAWSDIDKDGYYSVYKLGNVIVTVPALTTGLTITSIKTNEVEVVPPVAGTYTVKEGESVVVTYAPATGYKFSVQGENGVREATVSGTITPPVVEAIEYELTLNNSATATLTSDAEDAMAIPYGTPVKVTATANENYEFATVPEGWEAGEDSSTVVSNFVMKGATTITAPDATGKPVTVTLPLPQELPTGVTSLVVSQKVADVWQEVTMPDGKIDVGNAYVVVAIPAAGYTITNPIKSGTAEVGVNISVTKEDVEAKIGKQTFTVTVPELVNFTVAVTNGETEVGTTNGVYTFDYATNVKVAFTAATGYEIKTDTSTNIASLVENVVIAAPTVALKTFTVTFLNEDDSPYAVSNDVPYNTAFNDVKPKVNPTKEGDYTFAGWIPAGEPVISNSTYKATFTLNTYAITWAESENVVATNNGAQVESGITLAKDATITFYPTVGSITNIVVDDVAVDPVVSPYTFKVLAKASVLKVLAGEPAAPSPIPPAQGTVEYSGSGESAVAKIKPNPNVTQIDVNSTIGYMGKYEIPSSVTKITGVVISQLIIKTGEYDIAPACKLVNGGDIVLDDTKTVNEVPVKPTIGSGVAATDVKPADGAIAVKGIAGLYYALVGSDNVKTVSGGALCDSTLATETGAKVSLTDKGTKGAAKFYVIKVSINDPAAE